MYIEGSVAQMHRQAVQMRRNETRCSGVKRSSRVGEGEAMAAAAVTEDSKMTATSSVFVGGARAGAPFERWKTVVGARINEAWVTSKRSPGLRSIVAMMEGPFVLKRQTVLRPNVGPAWAAFRQDIGL